MDDIGKNQDVEWRYHPFCDFMSRCGFIAYSALERWGHIFILPSSDGEIEVDFNTLLDLVDSTGGVSERYLFEATKGRGSLHEFSDVSLEELVHRAECLMASHDAR